MYKKYLQRVLFLLLAGAAATGCASSQKASTTKPTATLDTSAADKELFLQWLDHSAARTHSLSVNGDISLDQGGSSNSASFVLKSKRLRELGENESQEPGHEVLVRVDSLSVEVKGPLGIKLARFLASPDGYKFYDIMHDETLRGPTDSHSLETLTHLNGVSLPMMSDLVYGLIPDGSRVQSEDISEFYKSPNRLTVVIHREQSNITETIDMGLAPGLSNVQDWELNTSTIRYRRWNGIVTDPLHSTVRPALYVQFSNPSILNGNIPIPQHIEAVAGENKLTLDYTEVQLNPSSLTVRISMP